jgi:hypothetical protein
MISIKRFTLTPEEQLIDLVLAEKLFKLVIVYIEIQKSIESVEAYREAIKICEASQDKENAELLMKNLQVLKPIMEMADAVIILKAQ